VGVALIGSANAYGITSASSFYPVDSPFSFYLSGSKSADLIEFVASTDGETIQVHDPVSVTAQPSECVSIDIRTAVCERFNGFVLGRLRDGDDTLEIVGVVDGVYRAAAGDDQVDDDRGQAEIRGSTGSDELDGGGGGDVLGGGHDDDWLRGGNDKDVLTGGAGSDNLRAGAGNDRLDGNDNHRDVRIDCGPGRDTARIDRAIDPRPRHCERVIRFPRRNR
jgi:Ca2+-binding RTX toxin-like protein